MSIVIKVEEIPDAATRQLIDHGLDEYNAARAGPDNAEDLWVIARDDGGSNGWGEGKDLLCLDVR